MPEQPQRALLVVDVQVDVMKASVHADAVVSRIADLVGRARERGVPVVWVRHHSNDLVQGTDGWQIVPQLVPALGEPIVEKEYGDAFADTDLSDVLRRAGADRVILCGAQSDFCIRSTFYGALYQGLDVTLVSDAHTTEDLRPWGMTYPPEVATAMINDQAGFTRLPGRSVAVLPASEAL